MVARISCLGCYGPKRHSFIVFPHSAVTVALTNNKIISLLVSQSNIVLMIIYLRLLIFGVEF